ncbi:unnamed protein product [Effrenium voratum]|uniref:Tetratricopeptide repeat protein n=1 Tax=Effrenium voratum TaxID=2562239 RepID=A0AA36NCE0_9DINO|nr:unnamed protein product [Effrenium voratum]CAJ1436777.1 unnamed protein product [Effrenium voratum]
MERLKLLAFSGALLTQGAVQEPDEGWPPEGHHIELFDDLGDLSFPINATAPAQRYFDQGFRLIAAFDFRRAVLSFRAAQRADPNCAMCVWGEAFALGPNLNSFDEPRLLASLPSAFAAAERARRRLPDGAGVGGLEGRLARALRARYAATAAQHVAEEGRLTQSFAREMEEVLKEASAMPEHYANLAALTADAWMNTQPWDYWRSGQLRPAARRAEQLLRGALAKAPRHAFCVHLLVHVTEASGNLTLLKEVRPYAELLPRLMPGAPHLQHMSFHTLMHTGGFHVADLDNEMASSMPRQIYPMHNLDTLSWVCRIQGRAACALEAAQSLEHLALPLVGTDTFETGFPAARFAAVRPLTLLAFGRWRELYGEAAMPKECQVDPFLAGVWHFALGSANLELRQLELLREKRALVAKRVKAPTGLAWKNFNGSKDWAMHPAPQILELAEWELSARLAEGTSNRSLEAWRQAARVEAALPYDEPPAWYLPVANRLGAALLHHGHSAEAEEVYSTSLSQLPHNGWALFGLLQLCERGAGGGGGSCGVPRRRFEAAWRHADVTLASSAEVQPTRVVGFGSVGRFAWLLPAALWAPLLAATCRRPAAGCYQRLEG